MGNRGDAWMCRVPSANSASARPPSSRSGCGRRSNGTGASEERPPRDDGEPPFVVRLRFEGSPHGGRFLALPKIDSGFSAVLWVSHVAVNAFWGVHDRRIGLSNGRQPAFASGSAASSSPTWARFSLFLTCPKDSDDVRCE